MDRKRLTRIAFATASDRLIAAMRSGQITRDAAASKLAALKAARDKRVSHIELAAFLNARRIGFILERKAA